MPVNVMRQDEAIVYVVDDDAQLREAVASLCRSIGLETKVFSSTEDLAAADMEPDKPGCLVLDVRFLSTAASGLEFQRTMIANGCATPIVFLSGHVDVRASVEAMKNGAVDFLLKPFRDQELLDAIRLAIGRDRDRRIRERALAELLSRFKTLTSRERDLARLIARGMLGKQIAVQLGISEVTVKVHRAKIMQKLQVHSLVDLARAVDKVGASAWDGNDADDAGRPRGLVKVG
jgi:FixJ family two-component response regulator